VRQVQAMTRKTSGLNLESLLSDERFKFRMAYHSHTRFATSESDVEVLRMPFCVSASSNINLSSSRGRYGSGKFILDIATWDRELGGVIFKERGPKSKSKMCFEEIGDNGSEYYYYVRNDCKNSRQNFLKKNILEIHNSCRSYFEYFPAPHLVEDFGFWFLPRLSNRENKDGKQEIKSSGEKTARTICSAYYPGHHNGEHVEWRLCKVEPVFASPSGTMR